MQIRENISLRPYNTFGMDVRARAFAGFHHLDELKELLEAASNKPGVEWKNKTLILGGGSNILLTGDYDGLVLRNGITGIEVVKEDEEYVYVKAGAGENWHELVMHCVEQGFAGLENLSLIPGSVGASPMQNIGAYGVEIKDVFHQLEAWHINDRTLQTFSSNDCAFGYRESVFKKQYKGQFVITSVTFRLSRTPKFHTSYGAIRDELEKMGVQELSIRAISQAVINIRSSKLPDPKVTGNAGSFFKNPVVPEDLHSTIKNSYPNVVAFPAGAGQMKLAAGWLIEQCGWKGFRRGDAGCYPKQALVLVNYGQATGKEIYQLSEEIIQSVKEKFGVELEREVNVV
jgi:UDP-N-acetylmuramate dehydrogenase